MKAWKWGKETNFYFVALLLARRREKSCYASRISELGKQSTVITVTVIISSLKKKYKNNPTFPCEEKDRKKEGEETEGASRDKVFWDAEWREKLLTSTKMSSLILSMWKYKQLVSSVRSMQASQTSCSYMFSTRQWQVFIWGFFSAFWSFFSY